MVKMDAVPAVVLRKPFTSQMAWSKIHRPAMTVIAEKGNKRTPTARSTMARFAKNMLATLVLYCFRCRYSTRRTMLFPIITKNITKITRVAYVPTVASLSFSGDDVGVEGITEVMFVPGSAIFQATHGNLLSSGRLDYCFCLDAELC